MKRAADSKPRTGRSFFISLSVHAALVALALGVVYRQYLLPPEPEVEFQAEPRVQLPAQIREHLMNVAKHDSMAPRPSYSRRLSGAGPSTVQVPEMPDVDLDQMLP